MDTRESFLPRDRLHALAAGQELSPRRHGSALFADISGFTRLTERLVAEHGPRRGAEELTARLNDAYEALIGEVDRFGGSVVGFSGDAITCWFDDGPSVGAAGPGAAERAVAAGAAMAPALAALPRDPAQDAPLAVKVAVATGPASRLRVGDPEVQHLEVVAGATMARLAACERLAAVGDVVADRATVAATSCRWRPVDTSDAEAARLVDGAAEVPARPWPQVGPVAAGTLDRWVLPGVNLVHGDLVTELRTTVPLFLGFEGIDYDHDPDAGEKLDRFVRWVQAVLRRYQASLLDITTGDKGSYLYAGFGAPVSHEDDALRAAAAALEIQQPPADLGFVRDLRLGLSRGTVRAGIVGSAVRRTYAALGDEVNLAARLMQRAGPGEVLVSGRVAQRLGTSFALESPESLQVKGKAEPVPVWRLGSRRRGAAPVARRSAPLVGRGEERATIDTALQELRAGRGGVLVLEGEPGLGKSRLVDHLLARARDHEVAALVGSGDAVAQATLFSGWRAVFETALGPGVDAGPEGLARRVTQLTGEPQDAAFVPLLAPVAPRQLPDNETTAGLTGQVRADRTLRLMVEVLRGAVAGAPTVLVLEDAHWLDTSSWALVQRVREGLPELLVVCATRPVEDPAPELAALLAAPGSRLLLLHPLAGDDVAGVACQRLGVAALPAEIADLVTARAEGNPFFAEELVGSLLDRGVIAIRDGRCELAASPAQLRDLDIPDTVEGVVTSRIDQLPDSRRLALKLASVVGRTFTVGTLQDISPVPEYVDALPEDLQRLAELDLVRPVPSEPQPTYAFKHAITQDVAYNTLLFRQRAQLHRAVAAWYERSHADNLAPQYATLAHHWRRALDGTPDAEAAARALEYGALAGEQALGTAAHVEASEEFRRVLALLDAAPAGAERDQRELHAQTMLGYALMNQRGYGDPDVEAAYSRAHELTGSRVAADDGPPLYGLFSYYASRGEYAPAGEVAAELLELGERLDDPQVRLIGHNALAVVSVLRGALAEGRRHAERSRDLADRYQDPAFMLRYGGDFRGYPRAWLSTAQCLLGEPGQARRTLDEALEVTADHPYTFGFMLTFGITPLLLGDHEDTLRCADRLTEVSQRYGFALLVVVADLHRGWARAVRGDAGGADLLAGSLPVIRAVRLGSFLPFYLALQAQAHLALGRPDDAAAGLTEAEELIEASGGSFCAPEVHRLLAAVHAARGEADQARARLDRAAAIADSQSASHWRRRIDLDRQELR